MQIVTTIAELRQSLHMRAPGAAPGPAFVPTMGALHAGHVSLLRAARAHGPWVAASLFVNPLQFAPGEDLARYPRTFQADCEILQREGCDLLFAPAPEEIYPAGATLTIDPGPLGDRLDGIARPGHFRGVATIVAKLFHLMSPSAAFFGQKDAAQVAVLRAMVRDLNFSLDLIVCPTIREPDGLAMSSRNTYLSPAERLEATRLFRTLQSVQRDPYNAQRVMTESLAGMQVEYAAIVDKQTLLPTEPHPGALVAVAVRVGTTRLIDNIILEGYAQ